MHRWVVVLTCMLLLRAGVFATVVVPADLRELASEAALIVRGSVTDVRTIATATGIESIATVAVESLLKGETTPFVSVRVPGGTIGRYRHVMVGAPSLRIGQRAVFFLARSPDFGWRPLGLSAGVARVESDPTTRRAIVRSSSAASGGSSTARSASRGRPLAVDEFESLVRVLVAADRPAARRP